MLSKSGLVGEKCIASPRTVASDFSMTLDRAHRNAGELHEMCDRSVSEPFQDISMQELTVG